MPGTPHGLDAAVIGGALVEAAPDAVVVVDAHGDVLLVNRRAEELFGRRRDELVGRSVELLIPESRRERHVAARAGYVEAPRTRPMGLGVELSARRGDGTDVPVEIALSSLETDGRRFTIATVRDISDRLAAEAELDEARRALATAEDRARIARDLHDTVIQRLFAVGLSLQATVPRVDEPVADRLQHSIDEIDETIRDIRTAIFGLHASVRLGESLRSDVLDLAAEAARTLGFEPRVRFQGLVDTQIPAAVRAELVPTLREALMNVAKHAEATRVEVTLDVGDEVVLRVADDGVGLADDAPATPSGGHGLRNMAARAARLGGTCTVGPRHGGGTLVEWRVPV